MIGDNFNADIRGAHAKGLTVAGLTPRKRLTRRQPYDLPTTLDL